MKYFLYDILLHISIAALLPYFLVKMFTARKYREGVSERFGFIGKKKLAGLGGAGVLWVHAVSVGETKAVVPLLRSFKQRNPGVRIVLSTVTTTGNRTAAKDAAGLVDALIYFPLDLSWVIKKVVSLIRPSVFIVVEKEIWPNLYRTLKAGGVPIVVVNGTISERSFKRFLRFRSLAGDIFGSVSFFCARTGEDGQRAVRLGVPQKRVKTFGNIKFDLNPAEIGPGFASSVRGLFGIKKEDMVFLAGSTHAGEEEIVLNAYKKLSGEFNLKLMIAPRHPERFGEVEQLLKKSGLSYSKRTSPAPSQVILLDTLGELMSFYSLCDIALVGGSLVEGIGGHNLLEPAFYSKPVLYGKHLTAYLGMAELLEAKNGGIRVGGERDLEEALRKLLSDAKERERAGKSARGVVEANRGAAAKTVEVIEGLIKSGRK